MFNIQFDTLWQRFQREQSRRRKNVILVLIGIIAVVVGTAIWIGWQNKELEERYIIINEQKEKLRQNEALIQRQLDMLTLQRDSLSIMVHELNLKNNLLVQANDSLIRQKTIIINYTQENKLLKDENEKLKQQTYMDMKNEFKNNEVKFGL